MERRKFTPYVTGLVAAVLIGSSTMGVMAAPGETKATEIVMTDLDVQGRILYTAEVDADSAYFNKGIALTDDYAPVYMAANDKSKVVGKMYNTAVCDILERTGVWYKVTSGDVNGYVKTTDVKTGKAAEKAAKELGVSDVTLVAERVGGNGGSSASEAPVITTYTAEEYRALHPIETEVNVEETQTTETTETTAEEVAAEQSGEEVTVVAAEETESVTETNADTETTGSWTETEPQETEAPAVQTQAPVVETQAPVVETEAPEIETEAPVVENTSNGYNITDTWETVYATDYVNVRSDAGLSAGILGVLKEGDSIVRTGIADNGWSRVDYCGSTAYVMSEYLTTTVYSEIPEEPYEEPTYEEPTYEEPTYEEPSYSEPDTNQSSTYDMGVAIVNYARQFLGNPYVYGGTSLTNGADCSGFVQTLYADFGYSINRTATTQTYSGYAVSVDELQPGDLIMYGYGGEIEHVAMYEGNGMIIHASTEETGIIESNMYYGWDIYACRRIFQ